MLPLMVPMVEVLFLTFLIWLIYQSLIIGNFIECPILARMARLCFVCIQRIIFDVILNVIFILENMNN